MGANYPPEALYILAQALLCLVYLAGVGAGIFAIVRKRTLPGILAAAAFFLLGINLVFNFLTWNVLVNHVRNMATLNWVNFCVVTPLSLLGVSGLVISIFLGSEKKESPTLPSDQGDPEGTITN